MKRKYFLAIIWLLLLSEAAICQSDPYYKIRLYMGEDINTYCNIQTKFKVTSYSSDDMPFKSFKWDFNGDGVFDQETTTNQVSHTYTTTGTFNVQLTVTTLDNYTATGSLNVYVLSGTGSQTSIAKTEGLSTTIKKSAKLPDGITKKYAVLINGDSGTGAYKSFWNDLKGVYSALKNNYGYDDQDIYLINSYTTNLSQSEIDLIDYEANMGNVRTVFNELANLMDSDDRLLVWISCHGLGYKGIEYRNNASLLGSEFDDSGYGVLYSTNVKVDTDDEKDYLERDFQLRAITTPGEYKCTHGMNKWVVLKEGNTYYRVKYVSHYSNLSINGSPKSDSDVYIEKLVDYLYSDINKDGVIDSNLGETLDSDGDGTLPYTASNNTFDEGDWGGIDEVIDNFNSISNIVPGDFPWDGYVIFDKDLDNKLDININRSDKLGGIPIPIGTSLTLTANGTDNNNDGLIDGIDVNGDGDKTDWLSIDEQVAFPTWDGLGDDELATMLDNIDSKAIVVGMNNCFSGGFIDDLSSKNRIIMTTCQEELPGWTSPTWNSFFSKGFIDAIQSSLADDNNDGETSMLEAFKYASDHSSSRETPQYDDNGDGISSSRSSLGTSSDGCLGEHLTISKIIPETKTLSGVSITTNDTYAANTIILEDVNISSNSLVTLNAKEITFPQNVTINLGSSLTINNEVCP